VWCSDITYIRLAHGFVYLTAVMDWASRYVLSWEVSVTMDDDFCINALKSPLRKQKTPGILIKTREHNIQVRHLLEHHCTKRSSLKKPGAFWINSSSIILQNMGVG
jgi:transposase InsO family protein